MARSDLRYLNGGYLQHNPSWHADDSSWKAGKLLEMISRNGLQPASLCEVGCGAGRVVDRVAQGLPSCPRVVGVDIAPDALELCRQLKDSRVEFRNEDATAPEFGPFELLLIIDVIEHVPDYLGFLDVMRPKADHKLFHIPLDLSALAALRPASFTRVRSEIGHLHYFTKEIALAALKETGYEILDLAFTSGAVELPAPAFRRRAARVPRRLAARLSPELSARWFGGFSLLVLAR